ncbi:MAG: hypothetical protein IKM71_06665 [Bacteroidaceae bacterium]|nr:hypothetical protein [Bacteroidaceae bacterium]
MEHIFERILRSHRYNNAKKNRLTTRLCFFFTNKEIFPKILQKEDFDAGHKDTSAKHYLYPIKHDEVEKIRPVTNPPLRKHGKTSKDVFVREHFGEIDDEAGCDDVNGSPCGSLITERQRDIVRQGCIGKRQREEKAERQLHASQKFVPEEISGIAFVPPCLEIEEFQVNVARGSKVFGALAMGLWTIMVDKMGHAADFGFDSAKVHIFCEE